MSTDAGRFSRTSLLLRTDEYGCEVGGSQVYVSRYGEPVYQDAVGSRMPGHAMTVDSSMMWTCCSKSAVLVPLAHLLSSHGMDEHTAVAQIIPEYAQAGKEQVRLSHVLTHTVGYQSYGLSWVEEVGASGGDETELILMSQDEALAEVCRQPIVDAPGSSVRYTAFSNWVVLAAIVERLSGRPYEDVTEELLLAPLGMTRTKACLRSDDLSAWAPTRAPLHHFEADGSFQTSRSDEPPMVFQRWPGVGFRGPAAEMARPIECLAGWRGRDLLDDRWRAKFTTAVRFDLPDALYDGAELQWSLGLCADPVPFGLDLSRELVGMTGKQSSFVFADLAGGVTVSFLSNKLVPHLVDRRRKISLVRSIMADLER